MPSCRLLLRRCPLHCQTSEVVDEKVPQMDVSKNVILSCSLVVGRDFLPVVTLTVELVPFLGIVELVFVHDACC